MTPSKDTREEARDFWKLLWLKADNGQRIETWELFTEFVSQIEVLSREEERERCKEIVRNFDVTSDLSGYPVTNPLMKLYDVKRFLLEELDQQ